MTEKAAQKCAECSKPAAHGSQFCSDACASRAAARQKAAQPEACPRCGSADKTLYGGDYSEYPDYACYPGDIHPWHDALPVEPPAAAQEGKIDANRKRSDHSSNSFSGGSISRNDTDSQTTLTAAEPAAQPSEKEAKPNTGEL